MRAPNAAMYAQQHVESDNTADDVDKEQHLQTSLTSTTFDGEVRTQDGEAQMSDRRGCTVLDEK